MKVSLYYVFKSIRVQKADKFIQVFSLINGLSDHEAQPLCVNNIFDDKWVILDLSKRD
jgi:hypothetical protein